MQVFITATADLDLLQIAEDIRREAPARAEPFVQTLLDHCQQLAEFPRRYPLVPRYEVLGIRRCVHGNYLIFYRVRTEAVDIIRILHGARDYESLLFPDA